MTFKKLLYVSLSFLLLLSITACAGNDIAETGTPASVSSEPTSATPKKPDVSNSSEEEINQPEDSDIDYPLEMWFSSGVGAWYTKLIIHSNGSFSGEFRDSNMGEIGDEYPNGTAYECIFSGYFSKPQQVNDYTYSLTLETIKIQGNIGESRIENGTLYKTTTPYGLMNSDDTDYAKEFLLYTPQTPTAEMREDFLSWWPERFGAEPDGKLLIYGLQNLETSDGFFTAKEN